MLRALLLVLLVGCAARPDLARERAALLELHEAQRCAHLAEDAEALVELLADDYFELADGVLRRPPREESQARFQGYFDAVEFLAWEDIAPPEIELSADGSLATMAVQKVVRLRTREEDGTEHIERALYAWLATCAKDAAGRWRLASVTSTRRPESAETTLSAARRALGPDERLANLRGARATLDCDGPTGPYRLVLDLALDGPWRLAWFFPGRAPSAYVLEGGQGWSVAEASGERTPLAPAELAVLRSHAFPLLVPLFERFFPTREFAGVQHDGARSLERLRLVDELGHAASALFDLADDHLVRLELLDARAEPPAPVTLDFERWQTVDGLSVPRVVVAHDARGTWRMELVGAALRFAGER
ncbi:MAG: hypothetical protein EXS08_14220 [Planctomycetes bacterium]|nr:hypothetical protein [Planctomycetota bacterium]